METLRRLWTRAIDANSSKSKQLRRTMLTALRGNYRERVKRLTDELIEERYKNRELLLENERLKKKIEKMTP